MKIKVRYYGQLTDITQKSEEIVEVSASTVEEFKKKLIQLHPKLKNRTFQVAQDNAIQADKDPLKALTIDLLPPFSGG
jgi:molybdopterin converting factor small subunit